MTLQPITATVPRVPLGAPIIDGMVAGFKMAEMMADICKLTSTPPASRVGFFHFPPRDNLEALRKFLGKPA